MEQILIYKPGGSSEPINSNSLISGITQAEHRKVMLTEDVITMTVESASVRDFAIGDYIKIFGLPKYKINQIPKVTKNSRQNYVYELRFEGLQYDLRRAVYRNTDITNVNYSSDFALVGDLEMFLRVIINNLNRVFGADTWALGTFPAGTETKNLLFNNESCLSVLGRLCEEYKYQFVFKETLTQNVLHVSSGGVALDYNFKVGQNKGLYTLTRENVNQNDIINTLYAYGSTKNLPADYKNYSPRLRVGELQDLPILETTSRATYGVFEGTVNFDDIYPHRTGTVSSINTGNRLQFTDSSMDFDLNEKVGGETKYLIPGNVAKVRFQTGNLSGFEFEITNYTHSDKTFTLKVNKDAKGLEVPSETEAAFQIEPGDTYVIVDIVMPSAYISAAEDQLAAKASEYLTNYSTPMLKYSLSLDEFFLKENAASYNVFEVGDTVKIEDADLGINTRIKITEFTRDILRPFKYTLTIQDTPQNSITKKILIQVKKYNDIIKRRSFDDPITVPKDYQSVPATVNDILNMAKKVLIGRNVEDIEVGNIVSKTRLIGETSLVNGDGKEAIINTSSLSENRSIVYPDRDIEVNNWDYLVGVPDIVNDVTPGSGLSSTGSGDITLNVNVDDITTAISDDKVIVKDGGISTAKIADDAITTDKIDSGAVTLSKLTPIATGKLLGRVSTGTGVVELVSFLDSVGAFDGDGHNTVASVAAIKDYFNTLVSSRYIGGFDASVETDFPGDSGTIKGDFWIVTQAGTVHGKTLNPGDWVIADTDNPDIADSADYSFVILGLGQATESVLGLMRLATQTEVNLGEDTVKAVTPHTLTNYVNGLFFVQDTITGTKNGINTTFTTSNDFVLNTTQVYVNGVRQFRGSTEDYQELSSNSFEIFEAPKSTDKIIVEYIKA